ncbi:MAG: hypothetical protein AYK18_08070 [Theionarchaea archaeon DG-70]|nr:MAG: hypothetical protein AYK18_08070 [Theionarchaea archaeon DG-70]
MKNNFAEELQERIMLDLKKIYSAKFLNHWQHPQNWGIMNDAHGYGKITGPCGDTMKLSIKVVNNKIMKCTFDTDGCGGSIACGSMVTEMAIGKTIREARQITQGKVLQFCGGLPEEDRHCALLVANTLQKAIDNYEMRQYRPKKL